MFQYYDGIYVTVHGTLKIYFIFFVSFVSFSLFFPVYHHHHYRCRRPCYWCCLMTVKHVVPNIFHSLT